MQIDSSERQIVFLIRPVEEIDRQRGEVYEHDDNNAYGASDAGHRVHLFATFVVDPDFLTENVEAKQVLT